MHGVPGWYRGGYVDGVAVGVVVWPDGRMPGPFQLLIVLITGRIVLTIAKLGVGQESYYLSKVAQGIEDYYTGKGEVPGAWVGRGAARLGLAGQVGGDELRSVLGGLDPLTGRRVAGRKGSKRTPGWDLTIS